ncbi:MAG TPA: hypothetical protein VGJ46_09280, partial [Candidatus Limnocylindrales bacterium]
MREDMGAANEAVDNYCDPIPGRPPVRRPAVHGAVGRIAELERSDPDQRFRIDDSEEPTTARSLLDDLRDT